MIRECLAAEPIAKMQQKMFFTVLISLILN